MQEHRKNKLSPITAKGANYGDKKELSRRNFMQTAIWGIGGLIGIGFGAPAIAYIAGPALKNQQVQAWMRLGPTSKVELGTPTFSRLPFKLKPAGS